MNSPKKVSVGPIKNWPKVAPQVLVSVSASWAVLCTGLVRGWSSPALPLLSVPNNQSIYLETTDVAWMASMSPLCALIGSLLISLPMQMYGRRWTLISSSVPFVLGFYLMGVSHFVRSTPLLYFGRIVTGLVSGATTPTAQIYVSECSSPRIRGTLGSFTATFMSVGILIAYLIGAFVEWHILCFLLGSFPIVLGLAMMVEGTLFNCLLRTNLSSLIYEVFMPETPAWLLSKRRDQLAREALQQLRGRHTDVDEEFCRIRNNRCDDEESDKATEAAGRWSTPLTSGAVVKPLAISVALMFFQQFSGINGVIFYSVTIFQAAGSGLDRFASSISIASVQLVCTLFSAFLVDRFGRRILLIVSGTFMSLSLAGLGVFFYIKSLWESQGADEALEAVSWMPLLCLIAFIVAYSSGYSAVPYVVMGELFPIRYRNVLSAVSTSFNLSCSFVVVRTFPEISRHLGFDLAFWFYGICCAAGVVFVLLILPETKGRTLEDISRLFSGKNDMADAGTQETRLQIIASSKD